MKVKVVISNIFSIMMLVLISCDDNSVESKNHAPEISILVANPDTVIIGQTSVITCTASDNDNDSLTYSWQSTSGNINGSGFSINWTAPSSEGIYSISCTVEDGNGGDEFKSIKVPVLQLIPGPSNEPNWNGGWRNMAPYNNTGQSFIVESPFLVRFEVNIVTGNTGNGGETLTARLRTEDQIILTTISQFVQEGFEGWLSFEIPGGGINVVLGQTLILELADTGKIVFGWKYSWDTYEGGSAFFFDGYDIEYDQFFRINY